MTQPEALLMIRTVMKIDRLLSEIVYLLNRDIVSARELSERFEVSVRTIQRDMETIDLSGIPITTIQGPSGGYGIMKTYKMDRQLLSVDDLFYIITSLKGIGSSIEDRKIDSTIEKMSSLVPDITDSTFSEKNEKLSLDFSMLGGNEQQKTVFNIVSRAVDSSRLLNFNYTNNKLETVIRTIEPMTLVFRWRAWYLYGFCRLKNDYRLFRISRIKDPEILARGFDRRSLSFEEFSEKSDLNQQRANIDIRLKFSKKMMPLVEEFYGSDVIENETGEYAVVSLSMPEGGWLYGYILSYGEFVEVLEPAHLRDMIRKSAQNILALYE